MTSQYAKIGCADHQPEEAQGGLGETQRVGGPVTSMVHDNKGRQVGTLTRSPANLSAC